MPAVAVVVAAVVIQTAPVPVSIPFRADAICAAFDQGVPVDIIARLTGTSEAAVLRVLEVATQPT